MKKNKTEEAIKEALVMTGLLVPVSSDRVWSGWEILCKQVPGQESAWLQTVDKLLRWEATRPAGRNPDKLFIARRYLLKDGKMVYGWYLKFTCKSADQLRESTEALIGVLQTSQLQAVVTQAEPQQEIQQQQRPQPQQLMRVLQRSKDDEGNVHEVTEMRLPHVTRDLNVPTKPVWNESLGKFVGGQKGAKSYGG